MKKVVLFERKGSDILNVTIAEARSGFEVKGVMQGFSVFK